MHSNIYEIGETSWKDNDLVCNADDIPEWFQNKVDYIVEDNSREFFLSSLKREGLTVGKDDDGDFLVVDDKEKFFEHRYEHFKEMVKKLEEVTLKEFSEYSFQVAGDVWEVQDSYSSEFSFQFFDSFNGEIVSFNDFVRNADVGKKYYIGQTFDYHY